MKIVYTLHALEKFTEKDALDLKINKPKVANVFKKPLGIDKSMFPHRIIGMLDEKFSLCVIYRIEDDIIIIITFYPSHKGRYESKILRGR